MTEQTSRLVIEISSEQAKKNAEELSKELVKIFTGGEKASDSTSKLGKTIQVTSNITQNFNTTVNNTTKAVEKQTQELAKQEKQVDKTGLAFKQFASFVAGYVTISTAIGNMDTYTQIGNKLKIVTTNQEQLNRAMEDTFAIAQRSYSSWNAVNDVYSKYMSNAKTLNLTQSEVARLTEITSKAVALSGSSAESAAGALFQYGQSLDGNILRAEEFNSLVDGAGGLLNAMATGLGVTRGQLRQMMLDGKLTGEVITKALLKAGDSVDKLHKKTDVTIKQSLLLLSDSVTKFIGEADHASGASKVTSEAIRTLSENIEPLANGAMALGIGLITKAILAKSIAVRSSIADSIQSRVANMAEAQAQVQLTGVVAIRAKQTTALALTELNLARIEFNGATTATARATAIQRVTAAEIAHSIAVKNSTFASAAYTAAQNAETVATSRLAAAKSLLLGLTGGWVGLAATVAGVSAGYLLMRDNGNEANKTLQNQSRYANLAANELDNLTGAQKRAAQKELSVNLEDQNHKLQVLKKDYELLVESVLDSNKSNKEAYRIWAELKAGVIDVDEAYKRLNNSDFVTSGQINQLTDSKKKIDEQKAAVKNANEQMNLVKTTGANAKQGFSDVTEGAKQSADEVKRLNEKLKDFNKSLLDRKWDTEFKLFAVDKGYTESQAEELLKTYKDAVAKGFKNIPKETGQLLRENWKLDEKLNKTLDARNEKEKDRTKELEKQLKVLQVNEKVKANAAKYGFENIESKYGILPGLLSGIHMQESRGNANAVGPMTKYGTAKGGFQFLDDTAKRFKLTGSDVFDLGKSAEAAAKYLQILYQKFGSWDKAISAYHAGEGNVEKGTKIGPVNRQYVQNVKGYIAGANGFDGSTKEFDSSVNDLVKFLQVKQDIELQYSSGEIQRKTEHEKKLADIQSHFSGDAYTKLERQENERFANENRLAELQFDLNVRGWNWTYEQRIQNEIDTQKVTISLNKEYSDIQKQIAKEEVDEKFAYELKKFRETQLLKQLEYSTQYTERVNTARDKIAQYSLNPFDYQKTALASSQSQAYASNNKAYSNDLKAADEALRQGEINQDQHYQRMLDAKRLYTDNDLAISLEHKRKEQELAKSQQQNQLQIWSGLVSSSQTMWSQLTQSVKDASGEQSKSYKTMFAMQQAFAIASTLIAAHVAAAQTTADITLPFVGKLPAASAILAFGYAQAGLIASQAIAGFATGGLFTGTGHVRGAGSETSDSINAKLSDYEFVTRAWAVKRIGVQNMNYMNRTGEMPYQREYEALKMQFLMPNKSEIVPAFKDGGLVGVSRMSNADVERRQFASIQQNSQQALSRSEPNIVISQTITFDTSSGTAKIDTQGQKDVAQSLQNMMDAWARRESRQGRILYNLVRSIK
ncbi:MAG: tape measure protein [Acinetobacter sp.]|jgi:tape measure domain-containing protein|uniref:tape measure protein n=1 Tax=Acinetobacter sp. TaxID=472 RepID=UPI002844EB27|nr:tape measure protein [Acinetobacter sp.]MDR3027253.1 tape measure protein [Acinetobacter sp.]